MSIVKLRERLGARMKGEESGFTLVELLVVMLILGLLAAIAIPAFFNQRDKAQDADAKASARTAQTAIETFATDNSASYSDADSAALIAIEPTLADATLTVTPNTAGDGYSVAATSETTNIFTITRYGADDEGTEGTTALTCTTTGDAGCPADGYWGGEAPEEEE